MRFKVVSESLLCMSLGNKVCGEAKNMEIGTSKAINMYGFVQVMTIQKFWGKCVMEVQLHCSVNVHLGESEL